MNDQLLRFDGAVQHDSAIDAWWDQHPNDLGDIARRWFGVMRTSGDEVRELLHDGCPVVCLGDAPFGYVNIFKAHVNIGFFHGDALPDPTRMLLGSGKSMRHVRLKPGTTVDDQALTRLLEAAYADIKSRVENG